jgi:hypothetical protein
MLYGNGELMFGFAHISNYNRLRSDVKHIGFSKFATGENILHCRI